VGQAQKAPAAAEPALSLLPQDARWDLARRCRALAKRIAPRGGHAWRKPLSESPAAQAKAAGGDDRGRWLPTLVTRLLAEEAEAAGRPRSIPATSTAVPSDGTEGANGRRLYEGFDLEELTVEDLALRHYLRSDYGFTCGLHCEGALLRDLFGILLTDELFDSSVEGVFMSGYQDAPLDLGTEAFLPLRTEALNKRLGTIASLRPDALATEVRSRFRALHGTRIRGVRWDRYSGPEGQLVLAGSGEAAAEDEPKRRRGLVLGPGGGSGASSSALDLGAAAGAIGGQALAAALRLLCVDYNSAGLPDLLLWSWGDEEDGPSRRARFVEVKSERDALSRRQRMWLSVLRGAGAEAEVCHIRDE